MLGRPRLLELDQEDRTFAAGTQANARHRRREMTREERIGVVAHVDVRALESSADLMTRGLDRHFDSFAHDHGHRLVPSASTRNPGKVTIGTPAGWRGKERARRIRLQACRTRSSRRPRTRLALACLRPLLRRFPRTIAWVGRGRAPVWSRSLSRARSVRPEPRARQSPAAQRGGTPGSGGTNSHPDLIPARPRQTGKPVTPSGAVSALWPTPVSPSMPEDHALGAGLSPQPARYYAQGEWPVSTLC